MSGGQVDASKRLGALKNGARDIMNHYFFNGIDWETMLEKVRPISRYRLPVVVALCFWPAVCSWSKLLQQQQSPLLSLLVCVILLLSLRLSVPR